MAYDASIAEVRKILEAGMPQPPFVGAAISKGGNSILSYCSSHAAGDITGTGFFTGIGAQPLSSTGPVPYESIARSTNNVGARPGDLLVNIESSGGATPGKITWHGVKGSTLASGGGGYNCTVSA